MCSRPQKCTGFFSSVLSLWVPPWSLKMCTLAIVFLYLSERRQREWETFLSQGFYNDTHGYNGETIVCQCIGMILFLVVLVHF